MFSMVFYMGAFVLLFFFIAIVGIAVYYGIYTRSINRQLQNGAPAKRALPGIPRIITVTLIVVLLLCLVTVIYIGARPVAGMETRSRNDYAVVDPKAGRFLSWHGSFELNDASFVDNYSTEEIKGYRKQVAADGDYTFTIFTTECPQDLFHPDFLCYVDYSGEPTDSMYMGGFFSDPDKSLSGGSSIGASYERLVFIGNLDMDDIFTIKVAHIKDGISKEELDKLSPEADFSDAAQSDGTVSITLK